METECRYIFQKTNIFTETLTDRKPARYEIIYIAVNTHTHALEKRTWRLSQKKEHYQFKTENGNPLMLIWRTERASSDRLYIKSYLIPILK